MGIGFVDIERVQIDSSAFNSVSAELVTNTQAIPVKRDGSTIWLAISQTDAMDVLDAYKMATGCRIIPVLATAKAISQAINRYFPAGGLA